MLINVLEILLKSTLFIYPLLPLIKEWSSTVGNIIELSLILGIYIILSLNIVIYKRRVLFKQFILANYLIGILFIYAIINDKGIYEGLSGLRIYIVPILLCLGISEVYCIKGKQRVLDIMKYIMYITIILAMVGVVQFVFPQIVLNLHGPDMYLQLRPKSDFIAFSIYNRVMSLMNDPNVYGIYIVLAHPIIDSIYLNKFISKNSYIMLRILLLINIILTNSRQALIIYIVYLLMKSIINIKNNKYKILVNIKFFIFLFIVFILALIIIKNANFVFEKILRVDTIKNLNGRSMKVTQLTNMLYNQNILNLMFGNGINTSRDFVFENSYILLIYQIGIIPIIFFILGLRKIYKLIVNNIENYKGSNVTIVIIMGLVAFIVGDYVLIPQITALIAASIFSIY